MPEKNLIFVFKPEWSIDDQKSNAIVSKSYNFRTSARIQIFFE